MSKGVCIAGRHSSEFQCLVKSKRVTLPSMKISKVSIPGQHGELIKNTGKYNNREIELTLSVKRNSVEELRRDLRYISSWLSNGGKSMKIVFDDEPDLYYEGILYEAASSETIGTLCLLTVVFDCKPFVKSEPIRIEQKVTAPCSIMAVNKGTIEHQPIIEIEGTADSITLSSDGGSFSISKITQKTIIDTEKDLCYIQDGLGQKQNKLKDAIGTLKILPGTMKIDVTGQALDVTVSIYVQDVFI